MKKNPKKIQKKIKGKTVPDIKQTKITTTTASLIYTIRATHHPASATDPPQLHYATSLLPSSFSISLALPFFLYNL